MSGNSSMSSHPRGSSTNKRSCTVSSTTFSAISSSNSKPSPNQDFKTGLPFTQTRRQENSGSSSNLSTFREAKESTPLLAGIPNDYSSRGSSQRDSDSGSQSAESGSSMTSTFAGETSCTTNNDYQGHGIYGVDEEDGDPPPPPIPPRMRFVKKERRVTFDKKNVYRYQPVYTYDPWIHANNSNNACRREKNTNASANSSPNIKCLTEEQKIALMDAQAANHATACCLALIIVLIFI